jgi:hypothetical protein
MQQPLTLITLFFTASCLLRSASVHAQNTQQNVLSGIVADSAGDKPLAGVSVFLNSTSIGTVTHADGSFALGRIPGGKYDLVISAIGYETFVTNIDGRRLPFSLKIVLHQKATVLQAFTVEPYLKDGWRQWGDYFIKNFIGATEYASSCTIKNKDVLRFHFSKKNNRLTVSATEPLIIENTALGYTLEFRLEEFASDFRTHIVTYYGYPFFREMTTTRLRRQEKWEEHRREAYTGSIMHFMRSLYHNHLQEDGFIAQHAIQVANTEKQRVKSIYHPDLQKMDSYPVDTLHYFWEVLKQPSFFSRTVRISADSLVTTHADGTRALFFTGKLTVIFGSPATGMNYRGSTIFLFTPAMVTIEETGNYYPPQEIISSGAWALSEKVANLLPLDYGQH